MFGRKYFRKSLKSKTIKDFFKNNKRKKTRALENYSKRLNTRTGVPERGH